MSGAALAQFLGHVVRRVAGAPQGTGVDPVGVGASLLQNCLDIEDVLEPVLDPGRVHPPHDQPGNVKERFAMSDKDSAHHSSGLSTTRVAGGSGDWIDIREQTITQYCYQVFAYLDPVGRNIDLHQIGAQKCIRPRPQVGARCNHLLVIDRACNLRRLCVASCRYSPHCLPDSNSDTGVRF